MVPVSNEEITKMTAATTKFLSVGDDCCFTAEYCELVEREDKSILRVIDSRRGGLCVAPVVCIDGRVGALASESIWVMREDVRPVG